MISEETLEKVREAFDRVRREDDVQGWGLDDQFISPFLQESGSDRLTVSLLKDDSGRTSLEINVNSPHAPEDAAYVSSLAAEIRRALREKHILIT